MPKTNHLHEPITQPVQYDLKDQVVIVTGGGGGIGSALVRGFCQAGAYVVVMDIDCAAAQAACQVNPDRTRSQCADTGSEESVAGVIGAVMEEFGHVDVLINCASVAKKMNVVDLPVDVWDAMIRVNLRGVFLMCKAVLPNMIERQYGRIVNFSSVDARKGRSGGSAYSATKAGLLGFTEALANEVARHGITVNAVLPAGVATPMWAQFHPDVDPATVATPDDLVDIVMFLASQSSYSISGAAIDVFAKRLIDRTYV
jgi:NAD(P)-dependent dehydrogenase (short-subunit alcohol dehydrogenase family)